ncbi:hypothetical protein GOODEAATRI_030599, partial [Goodea atripinnis]
FGLPHSLTPTDTGYHGDQRNFRKPNSLSELLNDEAPSTAEPFSSFLTENLLSRLLQMFVLLPAVRRLSRLSADSPAALLVVRSLLGAVSGAVLFLGIVHNFPLTFDLKVAVGFVFVGVCVAGGALSLSFRCTVFLTLPSILGSRGRAYLMVLILMVLYKGPISNIERNAESAALSLSCNLDLQVHHSRMLWRQAIRPFVLVTQELMDDKAEFESESLNISKNFQNIRDEVLLQYGYDPFQPKPDGRGNSTQEQFTTKTKMQCDGESDLLMDAGKKLQTQNHVPPLLRSETERGSLHRYR